MKKSSYAEIEENLARPAAEIENFQGSSMSGKWDHRHLFFRVYSNDTEIAWLGIVFVNLQTDPSYKGSFGVIPDPRSSFLTMKRHIALVRKVWGPIYSDHNAILASLYARKEN